ncbi:MAG: FHA domain-containing protein [Isosphaeraceae bacterium]|nr:FHA domain-containing protein [Isosphaeraceae bacterium]
MKVQLIVVQGKPEGKTIPLAGPVFRIGRGETCHLRPNSEQVSREHAEFNISGSAVVLRDLGSRNGTLVNGKAITEPCNLKDRDLVQVGPLTFAVSIQGASAPAAQAAAAPPKTAATPEDVSHDDIESWLVSDAKNPTPERPSGVYGGDTITIAAFKDSKTATQPKDDEASDSADDNEYERLPEGEGDSSEETEPEAEEEEEAVEEFLDESNPFYVKKKTAGPEQPTKPTYKDTSDAANDILRKMMERRKSSKS